MPESTSLPPCHFRSAGTTLLGGRERYVCTHVQICRPKPFEYVVEEQCRECPYVDFEAAVKRYAGPDGDGQPTIAEHAERAQQCRPCENRADNHCHLAGGSCSLAQKLTKADFACPAGRFEAIKR